MSKEILNSLNIIYKDIKKNCKDEDNKQVLISALLDLIHYYQELNGIKRVEAKVIFTLPPLEYF